MTDPLAEIITLLKPRAVFSKVISGAGAWAVRYSKFGEPSFCTMLDGECILAVDGQAPALLKAGDFVLLPATPGFTLSSTATAVPPILMDPASAQAVEGEIRHGRQDGAVETRMLGGYFAFDSPDAALLVSLLPAVLHIQGVERLKLLVQMVRGESLEQRSGRELVLGRLVEILLVEALRSSSHGATPGLLRGLADARLSTAIRHMHEDPAHPWTVSELAEKAALSRSAFFERFTRGVGLAPMAYLLAWRMALAKNLLGQNKFALCEIAEKIGYGSASSFSTAFSRHVGSPPSTYLGGQ